MIMADKTEQEQIDFFYQSLDRYKQAENTAGCVRRCYAIAETTVCLCFAGTNLVSIITPALAHLEIPEHCAPDLTLYIWDTESTGIEMVPPPCEKKYFTDRGDIWGFNSRRIKTAFHYGEYSVNLMDLQNRVGLFWVHSARAIPFWVYASPLRTLFHWWMEKNGKQLLHAAAVGTENGAALITGKGGVGKSTTALACLKAGFFYAADDYLIVGISPTPVVYSLYNTAKLNAEDVTVFEPYRPLVDNPGKLDKEKAVLFLYPQMAGQIKKAMPIKTILTPGVVDRPHTTISSIPHWKIQNAMAFTTMSQLPGVGRHTHDFINACCRKLPVYHLMLGKDMGDIPKCVGDLLEASVADDAVPPPSSFDSRKKPLVSVIIPVYNGERFIARAIKSICDQQYPAVELIVVNDGSEDATGEIVQKAGVDIRYFRQDNLGPAAARNRGIQDASGEFILFLDVDDFWPADTINLLVDHLLHDPDADVVRGYAQLVRKEEQSGEMLFTGNPKESFPDYIGAAIYRKSVFHTVGLFDSSLIYGEDSDWFTRARESNIKIKRLEEVTLFVFRHDGNMTRGKNLVELNMLHVFKKRLDRQRAGSAERKGPV